MSSMEDLNKTQLILLALLVSFVTSIATGITTVTLLEQAPPAITQTINRVVKETVRVVTPTESKPVAPQTVTQTVVVKEEDFVVKAVEKNSPNLVNIGYVTKKGFSLGTLNVGTQTQEVEFASVGFVFSPEGFVVLPNILFNDERLVVAESLSGEVSYNIVIRKRDEARGLALVQLALPTPEESKEPAKLSFSPVVLSDSNKVRLGQTGIALGVQNGVGLLLGVVSRLDTLPKDESKKQPGGVITIYTTVETDNRYSGGPLLNTDGGVIGINFVDKNGVRFTVPSNTLNEMAVEHQQAKTQAN